MCILRNIFSKIEKTVNTFLILKKIFPKIINYKTFLKISFQTAKFLGTNKLKQGTTITTFRWRSSIDSKTKPKAFSQFQTLYKL